MIALIATAYTYLMSAASIFFYINNHIQSNHNKAKLLRVNLKQNDKNNHVVFTIKFNLTLPYPLESPFGCTEAK